MLNFISELFSFILATFEGNLEAQAELMRSMGKITSATVIITNQIARMEDVSNLKP